MYLAQSVSVKRKQPVAVEPPPYVPVRRFGPFHGVAVQLASNWKAVERYGRLVEEVAALGANSVMLTVDVYQEHAGSGGVKMDPEHIPAREDLLAILRIADEAGLRVIMMPKVLLSAPRGNEWRGVIQPNDWNQWFASYTKFLDYIADVAREGRAAVLMIGSELVSTEKYTDRWNAIIGRMRKKFDGLLGYSANWDHYKNIKFWNYLDLAGITTYHTLAEEPCPPLERIIESWKPIKHELLEWQAAIGKPLFFTEVGWCSRLRSSRGPRSGLAGGAPSSRTRAGHLLAAVQAQSDICSAIILHDMSAGRQ